MPLLQYVCPACGSESEELVKNSEQEVFCKKCGEKMNRSYSGKMYGATGKSSGGCSGDCSHCAGCDK